MFAKKLVQRISAVDFAILSTTKTLGSLQKICSRTTDGFFLQRNLSSSSPQLANKFPGVEGASLVKNRVEVQWSKEDNQTGDPKSQFPLLWLRDNCQCDDCYSHGSIARKFLMDNLEKGVQVSEVRASGSGGLEVLWDDGHVSPYSKEWLNGRRFETSQRNFYRHLFKIPKENWTPDFVPEVYDYETLMSDDKTLFSFLCSMERNGVNLVKKVASKPEATQNLTERIGRVQATHYGDFSSVEVQDDPENVSYSNFTLNLHNDLPQYINQPGIIFLHMMKQHRGEGGDTTVSDGVRAAEEMRHNHPEQFKVLTTRGVYFLAKGFDSNYDGVVREFFKVNKEPIIELDAEGGVISTHFNNQGRESHVDMTVEETEEFYESILLFFKLIKKNSIHLRLEDGDMAVVDNHRCQHGRLGFKGQSERHLVTTYMSWDEALCMRRKLHEKFLGKVI